MAVSHATFSLERSTSISTMDPVHIIRGTAEGDTLTGTPDRDDIYGESGDDVLYGLDGDDHLFGGNGNDSLNAFDGNDRLSGDNGQDQLYGGPGQDTIFGGSGRDFAFGASGDDRIFGGADADWLYGGVGKDVIEGAAGNDLLGGGDGNDRLRGNAGHDELYGGLGRDDLWGGAGNDDLRGGWNHDTLHGDVGNDRLFGERGNDRLFGGDGNDTLYGDGGSDYALQARMVVPAKDPGFLRPREMILTDGETLVVRSGLSEILTYDVDTQQQLGQFTPLPEGRLLDISVSDGQILLGSQHRAGTSETALARLYDPAGHVIRNLANPNPADTGFGTRVALNNDHAVVVSDKAAYVFDADSGRLEHTVPLPPSPYGPGWPPLDVEVSGDTIAIHAGAYEGEELYILNAGTGNFVRQIDLPEKMDGVQDSSSFRSFELTDNNIIFSEPRYRESNPDGSTHRISEPVDIYDANTGSQVSVLERSAPDSLSPIYARMVTHIGANDGEVAVSDQYVAGPFGPNVPSVISVLDLETGKTIQRLDDPDLGQLSGFAFSGGVLAIGQIEAENPNASLVSLFWRDQSQDGGDDILRGGSGNDRLFGGSGRDEMFGGAGNDRLVGGPGRDQMFGGTGSDVFVVGQGRDHDRIMDFGVGDRILIDSAGVASPDNLETTRTATGTMVTAGSTMFEMIGIHENQVNSDWFMFA